MAEGIIIWSVIATFATCLLLALLWNLRARPIVGFMAPKTSFYIGNIPSLRKYCNYPFLSELHWAAKSRYTRFALSLPLGMQGVVLFNPRDIRTVLGELVVLPASHSPEPIDEHMGNGTPEEMSPQPRDDSGPRQSAEELDVSQSPGRRAEQRKAGAAGADAVVAEPQWTSAAVRRVDRVLQRAEPLWVSVIGVDACNSKCCAKYHYKMCHYPSSPTAAISRAFSRSACARDCCSISVRPSADAYNIAPAHRHRSG